MIIEITSASTGLQDANPTIRLYATPPPPIPIAHRASPQLPADDDVERASCIRVFLSLVSLTFDLRPPKWEKICPDSSRTRMQNFTPLSFSAAEKSVTVQKKNKQTKQRHSKLNTPPYYRMVG